MAKRLLGAIVTMLIIATIVFFVMNIIPGDPAKRILGEEATAEDVRKLRESLGLDRPLLARLAMWYSDLLRGDLGQSLYHRQPVASLIAERLEVTFLLTGMAIVLAVALGVPLGVLAALRPGTALDLATMAVALGGVAIPNFWLGLNLILLFALHLRWLPTAGYVTLATNAVETMRHLLMPAAALGLAHTAVIARMTRADVMEALHEDYVRTARAKGLPRAIVIGKHVLRNSLIPTLGVIGISMALMLSGAIIIETVFTLPGIGTLVVSSILRRDFPVIQGVLMFIALMTALVNLAVDLLYALFDPRIRYDEG